MDSPVRFFFFFNELMQDKYITYNEPQLRVFGQHSALLCVGTTTAGWVVR